ncbi:MAG: hypothetical protein ACRENQ_17195 [Gemmatimonadaceae bacterium]
MRLSWCAAAVLFSASFASAQRAPISRLNTVLDAPTRAAVLAIIDSARVAGLPSDVLVNKALEGAGKRADDPRIVAAVHELAGELRRSRAALGGASRDAEITAGAHAIHAGVTAAELTALRHAAVGRPLTTPIMVLTDLVARGVPPATASTAVASLERAGLRNADFTAYQRSVRQDIDRGADPAAATTTRARGAVLHRGGGPIPIQP